MSDARLPIGIVGCSAEGAALCYRTICAEGEALHGPHGHPEVSMHTHCLTAYVECLERDDWPGVAALMLDSSRKLAAAGAGLLICPDNTIHQAMELVRPGSTLPWLHIAEIVAADAARRRFRQVGILGTAWLVRSEVYPRALEQAGIAWRRPSEADLQAVHRILVEELVRGEVRPGSVAELQGVVGRLKQDGCDAVALACTELPLALDDDNAGLPTLDSTRLLARAALLASRNAGLGAPPPAGPGAEPRP